MMFSTIGLLAWTIAVQLVASAPCKPPPTVYLKNGTFQGFHNSEYKQDIFLGMPYAKPPVGDLRLRKPQSLDTSWTGVRDATVLGNSCSAYPVFLGTRISDGSYQIGGALTFPSLTFSEDCLTINVGRPTNVKQGTKLPVLVWIYGGGFSTGSSQWPVYNISWLIDAGQKAGKEVIVVTFNYRLNVFGMLAGDDLGAEGNVNLALQDQRLALHWLQENIEAFGGDPSRVTIFGESA
jgi:carboxylesterase type B